MTNTERLMDFYYEQSSKKKNVMIPSELLPMLLDWANSNGTQGPYTENDIKILGWKGKKIRIRG